MVTTIQSFQFSGSQPIGADAAPKTGTIEELSQIAGVKAPREAPDLPPMPMIVPPETNLSKALSKMGDQIIKTTTEVEKNKVESKSLSAKLEGPTKKLEASLEAGAAIQEGVSSVIPDLPELKEADLGLAGACLEGVASFIESGMNTLKLTETIKKIKEWQTELETKRAELTPIEIEDLEAKIKSAEERKGDLMQDLVSDSIKMALTCIEKGTDFAAQVREAGEAALAAESAKGTAMPLVQGAAKAGSHAVQALPVVSGVAGSVLSVVTVALTSKALNDNRALAGKINQEIESVKKELESAKEDPFLSEVLQLRLQNLQKQYEENAVNTVKNALACTSGVLGAAVAAKTVALAVGATVGVTLGTAVTATGIGAIVIGSAALVVGAGYLTYKNRHAIQNKLQNVDISRQEFFNDKKIKNLQEEKIALREFYDASSKTLEQIQEFEEGSDAQASPLARMEDSYRGKIEFHQTQIDRLKTRKTKLNKTLKKTALTEKTIDRIASVGSDIIILDSQIEYHTKKMQEVMKEKDSIHAERGALKEKSHRIVEKARAGMHRVDLKIIEKAEDLRALNARRNEINDAFKYGKDVAKFGKGANGEEMNWKTLKEIHDRLYETATASSLDKLQKFFAEQNKRITSDVATSGLKERIGKENFWDLVVKGVTAQVK